MKNPKKSKWVDIAEGITLDATVQQDKAMREIKESAESLIAIRNLYVEVGFTEDEAFELVRNILIANLKNGK